MKEAGRLNPSKEEMAVLLTACQWRIHSGSLVSHLVSCIPGASFKSADRLHADCHDTANTVASLGVVLLALWSQKFWKQD